MSKGRRVILLVDDEIILHRAIARAATEVGIAVLHATNGTEGVQLAIEKQPDLVLLDMTLPDLDGEVVLQRLKAAPETKGIPVVIYSGRTDHEDRIGALGLGAEDYFEKPFDLDMLMRRVEHHIYKASEKIARHGAWESSEPVTSTGRSKN